MHKNITKRQKEEKTEAQMKPGELYHRKSQEEEFYGMPIKVSKVDTPLKNEKEPKKKNKILSKAERIDLYTKQESGKLLLS